MALLRNVESKDLFGDPRAVPLRLIIALGTTLLLCLSGDLVGWWPLAWVALVPVCVACRGAGMFGAFLLAACSFGAAALLQSFWLLDVADANLVGIWLSAALLAPVAFAAMEAPILRIVPWPLRPLLMGVLAIGFWALLAFEAEFLIPLGGLIDSEFLRFAQPKMGLASFAGIFTAPSWLVAEAFWLGRKPSRAAFLVGCGVVTLLCAMAVIDWAAVNFSPRKGGTGDRIKVIVVPGERPAADSAEYLNQDTARAIVLWRSLPVGSPEERSDALLAAANLADTRDVIVALVLDTQSGREGYLFLNPGASPRMMFWGNDDAQSEPLVTEGVGNLKLFPHFRQSEHWSTQWDLDLYVIPQAPAHPVEARFWVREARRAALIRGVRTAVVWHGGGALITVDGELVEETSSGEVVAGELFAGTNSGEAVGHPRLRVIERILANSAPILSLMLLLLTPIVWLKRRRRAPAPVGLAIEEVFDESSILTKDQTDTITRRLNKKDADETES